MAQKLGSQVAFRLAPDVRKAFFKKAAQYELSPSNLARELISAFIEDRITITPPVHVKELYK